MAPDDARTSVPSRAGPTAKQLDKLQALGMLVNRELNRIGVGGVYVLSEYNQWCTGQELAYAISEFVRKHP